MYHLVCYSFLLVCFLFQLLNSSFLIGSFLFSSFLLKYSLITSLIFPNSVNILIPNALNYLSGKLFISVSLFIFFQEFSHACSIESSSSAFSFCLTFSASVNLSETATYCGLECVSYVGASLYRPCVPSAFGGRAGFDVDASHIFPQGVLELSPW